MEYRTFILNFIEVLSETLAIQYGTPDHNNKKDPLDELVFIFLSKRTGIQGYEKVYDEIKRRYRTWDEVLCLSEEKLYEVISPAGLGRQRVRDLKANLFRIKQEFGYCTLEPLKNWCDLNVFTFLTNLEGIGPKSAYCIMMYSFEREVFPVDTHVLRICRRLGLIEDTVHRKPAQLRLAEVFPASLRYSLHVNMLAHGRSVCRPDNPRCNECGISNFCNYYRINQSTDEGPGFLYLFSGAGGMGLGFKKAGFRLVGAIESDGTVASTMFYNHKEITSDVIYNSDVKHINPKQFKKQEVCLIIATIPLEELISANGKGGGTKGRNELFVELTRFVQYLSPKYIVLDIVPEFENEHNGDRCSIFEEGLQKAGYATTYDWINPMDYGILLNRKQLIFIAKRSDANSHHQAFDELKGVWYSIHNSALKDDVSYKRVIPLSVKTTEVVSDIVDLKVSEQCSEYTVVQHNLEKIRNRMSIDKSDMDKMLPSNLSNGYFKHDKADDILRQLAASHSFPEDYLFLGSYEQKIEQIKMSFPPLLAEIIARVIKKEINDYEC